MVSQWTVRRNTPVLAEEPLSRLFWIGGLEITSVGVLVALGALVGLLND